VVKNGSDDDTHFKVLEQYLCIGPSEKLVQKNQDLARQMVKSNTLLKINLALFYLSLDESIYVELILTSIKNSMKKTGVDDIQAELLSICDQIQKTEKEFWESTDRGNFNIYYSPYKEHLEEIKEIISDQPVVS
jgi:hypothetical protein